MSSTCPHNMVNLRPTSGWDRLTSLGHPCRFQLVSRLGSVTARHLLVGISQTLRRWIEGATYIRQGDHHIGHWPTFLVDIFTANIYLCEWKKAVDCMHVNINLLHVYTHTHTGVCHICKRAATMKECHWFSFISDCSTSDLEFSAFLNSLVPNLGFIPKMSQNLLASIRF